MSISSMVMFQAANVCIDYPELIAAYQDTRTCEHIYWLDLETGRVLLVGDWVEDQARKLAGPDETEERAFQLAWCLLWKGGKVGSVEQETEEQQQVETLLETFAEVPQCVTYEAYELMADFTATVQDSSLRDLLEVALHGRGAFRRFKDVLLRAPEERERWFTFQDQEAARQLHPWLASLGFMEPPAD